MRTLAASDMRFDCRFSLWKACGVADLKTLHPQSGRQLCGERLFRLHAMPDEEPTRPRFARLRKTVTFGAAGLIAVALCIGIAVLHSRAETRRVWAEIQKRLDAIRATGEPVTADDLAKLYPDPPPERDAALLLAPAVAALQHPEISIGPTYWELPPRSEPLTLQVQSNIEATLNDNQTALNAIPWDKITNAWVGSGFALGFSNLYSIAEYHDVDLARILCFRAIIEVEDGNGTKADEDLRRALALVRTIRPERLMYLKERRGGEALVCAALERVVNRVELSTNDLAAWEQLLSDDYPEGLSGTLLSLRCQNIWDMNNIRADPIGWLYPAATAPGTAQISGQILLLSGKIYSDADFLEMLKARSAQIAALKLPLKDCFAEFDRIRKSAYQGGRPRNASWAAGAARDLTRHFAWTRRHAQRCRLPAWLWKSSAGGWLTAGARRIPLPNWSRSTRHRFPWIRLTTIRCAIRSWPEAFWFTASALTSPMTAARKSPPIPPSRIIMTSRFRLNGRILRHYNSGARMDVLAQPNTLWVERDEDSQGPEIQPFQG